MACVTIADDDGFGPRSCRAAWHRRCATRSSRCGGKCSLAARCARTRCSRRRKRGRSSRGSSQLPSFARAHGAADASVSQRMGHAAAGAHRARCRQDRRAAARQRGRRECSSCYAIADPDRDIAPGYQGIPEPLPHCRVVATRRRSTGCSFRASRSIAAGRRLGYGGGYYDRLLPLLAPRATRVVGAFDVQIVERVPAGPHDVTIDLIVTPSETIVTATRVGS